MKILFIIPGSGDSFYCGNCFRDSLQATALRGAGHDVTVMPLYLPLKHKSFQADTPLFFPATTYYAAQKFFKKVKMPAWLERITGSDTMLNLASSLSGTTSAGGMEDMTLSMITGGDAAFARHVNRLTEWIKDRGKPDVIHLSSPLLTGIAKAIREQTDIPIVCSLQDEELWIDGLNRSGAERAWRGIAENIRHIDRFITTSRFYRNIAGKHIPQIKDIDVIYPGVNREKYAARDVPDNPVIGFFYRMNRENGLDILAEAFVRLKRKNTVPNLKLKIGGGYNGRDRRFLKRVKKILSPYAGDVEISDAYSLDEHARFYRSVTVISVPITFNEGVGLYLCEAFAAGRPAVEPDTGSFREIVDEAGLTYSPNSSDALAEALENILTDKSLYKKCADKALELSRTRYDEKILAEQLAALYRQLSAVKK
jgi:glycosyltransferase involved in cell wall biosynthesis